MKHEGSTIRLGNNSYSVAPGAEKRTLSAAAREVETTKDLKTKLKAESNKRKRSRNRCELASTQFSPKGDFTTRNDLRLGGLQRTI